MWGHLKPPLSSCRHHRDKKMDTLPKVTSIEVVGLLIDKGVLESAAKYINRRRTSGTNNGNFGGGVSRSSRGAGESHTRRIRSASTKKCAPRRHPTYGVSRGDRLLWRAGLRERKDTRKRDQTTAPIAQMVEIGPVERVSGRSLPFMVSMSSHMIVLVVHVQAGQRCARHRASNPKNL